ncbi:uncharacterized protein PAC_17672 [Phialocephala subalpina]|uniref:Zn(2)-C6 fungal-type domain-containing protein n=1 Tax=Phialocephala subalpina TaxID=576137 RepID=A0A1L7XRV2_9HELO|nr:uncharacterized protein PAC_17672 [Phialocephala subalpina]
MTSSEDDTMDTSTSTNFVHGPARDAAKNAKRSCNNCRQQKLKCDVVESPFKACSRCRRLQKDCRVEREFKRVGKRDKYAAMQREIDDLRRQLKVATQASASNADQALPEAALHEAPHPGTTTKSRQLGDTDLSGETVDRLFKEYFTQYHPYLPFLNPEATPDHYFNLSPLLGWSIIIIAGRRFRHGHSMLDALTADYNKLLWSTISETPQPFHVVKALCLICTWPLPSTTNPSDATYSLSSMMISIALQNVLDFPIQMQFSRKTINEDEQRDRRLTWAACNIVAQCTSTAYGFPSQANFDRLLGSDFIFLSPYNLPQDILDYLRISQLYATIGTALYGKASDPNGLPPEDERAPAYNHVRSLYGELVSTLGPAIPMTTEIFLLAANVHLNSFTFFLPVSVREAGLLNLFNAACTFIQKVMDFETSIGTLLEHCTNIMMQSMFSSIFALLKLIHSSFSANINVEHGRASFNAAIIALRSMSIRSDDVCSRMAVRVPQTIKDLVSGYWSNTNLDPLELKIRTRMSVNHNYDSMWHWLAARRQESQSRDISSANVQGKRPTMSEPHLTQPEIPGLAPVTPLNPNDFELFNSMDWILGDFSCGPYDLEVQVPLI